MIGKCGGQWSWLKKVWATLTGNCFLLHSQHGSQERLPGHWGDGLVVKSLLHKHEAQSSNLPITKSSLKEETRGSPKARKDSYISELWVWWRDPASIRWKGHQPYLSMYTHTHPYACAPTWKKKRVVLPSFAKEDIFVSKIRGGGREKERER